ncbi:MAG: sulfotransferase domain-containing protein [Bacteroidales bacterium]|nr:sulfotransferase domain-containing protein [Bacteroidales bacterium]MCM1414520.1 sulfotransferase domain-containing protein [bacterium]MCM1422571.1 sulfotransferase domain-containing protein [bacterium]
MNEKVIIRKNLQKYFMKNDNKKIVILPLRNLSGMVKDILSEEYGIQEQFLIDNYSYDMRHIYPMNKMPEGYEDCTFMLVAFGTTRKTLMNQLLSYVSEDKIVDLLFEEERERVFASSSKVHIDFICAGFGKSGTTSLQYALEQNPKIFLPRVKETYFLRYAINETTHAAFKDHFKAEDVKGKLVGDIDPGYRSSAEEIYRYCGDDLKLIFCVRNPVNALYSRFKMAMRGQQIFMLESRPPKSEMMGDFDHVCPELFEQWSMKFRFRKRYADYIKTFLEYYPTDQIKIIVNEELYADVHTHMNDLQSFLGISDKDRLDYQEFPRENIGNKVSKDPSGLEINISIDQLRHKLAQKNDTQSLELLKEIRTQVEEFTLIDYNEPMLESTRQNLLDYYMDSIHDLEGMIGRSLQGVWY